MVGKTLSDVIKAHPEIRNEGYDYHYYYPAIIKVMEKINSLHSTTSGFHIF